MHFTLSCFLASWKTEKSAGLEYTLWNNFIMSSVLLGILYLRELLYYVSLQLSRPAAVHVDAAPGTYSVTAARWGGHKETTHVVRIEPGQAVNLTLSLP